MTKGAGRTCRKHLSGKRKTSRVARGVFSFKLAAILKYRDGFFLTFESI